MMEALIDYGVLGLWTISNMSLIYYLIKKGEQRENKLSAVVENNTQALTLFNNRRR